MLASLPSQAQDAAYDEEEKIDAPIVVELFTTTDCRSCVLADRLLYDSMKNKNVIALSCRTKDISNVEKIEGYKAEGVASQKYDGPMDPCVFRQWAYKGGRSNDVTISLPLFIMNGKEQINGTDTEYFSETLNNYQYAHNNKTIEIFMKWKDADTVSIHLPQDAKADGARSASLWLIRYKDIEIEKVNEGVNQGRVLRFSNVVQSSQHIGKWHKQTRIMDVDVPKPQGGKERGGYVVVAQTMMGEPVLAAGILVDYPHPNDKPAAPARTAPANP